MRMNWTKIRRFLAFANRKWGESGRHKLDLGETLLFYRKGFDSSGRYSHI